MATVPGRWVPLSLPRRWVCDMLRVSRSLPIISFERRMNLSTLAEARQRNRIPWSLLFTKGFALVAQRVPELRRAYVAWLWPHYYEAEFSHCSFAFERDFQGEPAVFFGVYSEPAIIPLVEMARMLENWKTAPVQQIRELRKVVVYSRLPWFLRRLVWAYAFYWSGRVRAHNFGTFGISITANSGGTAQNIISPVTTTLNYGLFDAQYNLDVRLHFDHRVYDGMLAARVLRDLESTLNGPIAAELDATRR